MKNKRERIQITLQEKISIAVTEIAAHLKTKRGTLLQFALNQHLADLEKNLSNPDFRVSLAKRFEEARSTPAGLGIKNKFCIMPSCKDKIYQRGYCYRCYLTLQAEVSSGATSWANLERSGLALPFDETVEKILPKNLEKLFSKANNKTSGQSIQLSIEEN